MEQTMTPVWRLTRPILRGQPYPLFIRFGLLLIGWLLLSPLSINAQNCNNPGPLMAWDFDNASTLSVLNGTANTVGSAVTSTTLRTIMTPNATRAIGSGSTATRVGTQDYCAQAPLRDVDFEANSPNAARFTMHIAAGAKGTISGLSFEKTSYRTYVRTAGSDLTGVRILRDGVEIFAADNYTNPANSWALRQIPLNINLDGRPTTLTFEILGYGTQAMINEGSWVWALDNVRVTGCWCANGRDQSNTACSVTPVNNDTCAIPGNILRWNFDNLTTSADINMEASTVSPLIEASSHTGVIGTCVRANGSMMYIPETGMRDNSAQFWLRETQFVPNSPNSARFNFHVKAGATGHIRGIRFEKTSYQVNMPTRGPDPCGVRLLKDGVEIFRQEEIPVATNVWLLRQIPLDIELDGRPATYTIEILGYGTQEMVNQGNWAWAIDNLTLQGCWCVNSKNQDNAACTSTPPSGFCAIPGTILNWRFDTTATLADLRRTPTVVARSVVDSSSFLGLTGTYVRANGSMLYDPAQGIRDNAAQFWLRETRFVPNSPNAARFNFHTKPGTTGTITGIRFEKNSYRVAVAPVRGVDPCGIRILKNGVEVFQQTDIPLETNVWQIRQVPLNIELDGSPATYTIEILGYGTQEMINQGNWAWAIDNLTLQGCWCDKGKDQAGLSCTLPPPPAVDSCVYTNTIIGWDFDVATGVANPNRTASEISPVVDRTKTVATLNGTYQLGTNGSNIYDVADNLVDRSAQFWLRETQFVENSANSARFTFHVKAGAYGRISGLRFDKTSYQVNWPAARGVDPCGVRILKNGVEIVRVTDLPVETNVWSVRHVPLNIELDGMAATYTIEILGYGSAAMVAAGNWAWAIDNIKLLGCWCVDGKNQLNATCTPKPEPPAGSCARPNSVIAWNFNNPTAAPANQGNPNATVASPILSSTTSTVLSGSTVGNTGSGTVLALTGTRDNSLQFPLRHTEFVDNSPNAARFTINIKNGTVGHISSLRFEKNSYMIQVQPVIGRDPCGVRVLRNGVEIVRVTDLPLVANVWIPREIPLNIDLDGSPSSIVIEILGYGTQQMVDSGIWFWAIDNLEVSGCWCSDNKDQNNKACNTLLANNDNTSTPQNTAITITPLSNDSIPAGCRFQNISITQQPINGSVILSGNNFIYTPNRDFIGNDVFKYVIATSCGNSNEATVTVVTTALVDTDKDGIADITDLDDDNDGILDTVENAQVSADTDGDGVPNRLDLDSDNDGINDVIEANGTDLNRDGIADGIVGITGIPATAGNGLTPPDSDGDTRPNPYDLDSDNDGINDLVESGNPLLADANGDGMVDGTDPDNDGILGAADAVPTNRGDNNDPLPVNTDGTDNPNYIDLDSDNDGLTDLAESGIPNPGALDTNGDGRIDNPTDTDGDGIPQVVDGAPSTFGDANNPNLPDSNGNGIPDYVDPNIIDTDKDGIADNTDLDDDNDGILDTVENAQVSADTDGDGVPNRLDLDSDNDGINDVIEANGTDLNRDGIADGIVSITGIPATAGNGLTPPDSDGDTRPNPYDLDSDNDGINDLVESGNPLLADANGDGMVDGTDPDNDGILGAADAVPTNRGDNNDPLPVNTDGTDNPNYIDLDSDNDGLTDLAESGIPNPGTLDTNGDGRIDNITDTDGDGIPQVVDGAPSTFGDANNPNLPDSNNNGIPDYIDPITPLYPVAVNDSTTTPQNTPVTINVLGNDNLNGGTNPVISIVSQSPNGTATVVNGQIQFTPNNGFSGITTFTYRITASNGTSNIATVTVNVQSGNNGNICTDPEANVKGGSGSITITGITTSAAIIQVFNASWNSVYNQQVNTSSVTIPNLPAGNYTVKVSVLGAGGTWPLVCEKFVPVTVNAGGSNPPTAVNDNATTPQNTAVTITPLTNDQIPSGCTVQALSIVQQPTSGSVTVNGNNFLFTPANGFSGNVTFSYNIQSSCGTSNTATVTVNVQSAPQNPPVAVNDSTTTPQNTPVTINVLGNDNLNGGTNPIISIVSQSPNGTASVVNGQIQFTPNNGFSGITTFTYRITASNGTSNIATVTVNVQSGNNGNICTDPEANVKGGSGSITITGITTSAAIIQVFNASWNSVYNQQVNTSSVTIPNLPAGNYTVKVSVLGAGGTWPLVCEKFVPVTVNAGGSNPPTAVNDNATTPQNTAVTITPLTNDQIPSGCTVQALSIVQQPTSGSVTVNGNNFLFTPANGFSGNVTFSYRIQSSCGTSNTATVTVNVQSAPQNPPVAVNDSTTTAQNTPVTINVLGNDNLNGGTNPVISIVSQSLNGTASVVNGQIQFTPNNGFSGITTFTYRITASNGTSNTATVTVNVQSSPQNPPVAVNDSTTTAQNTPVTINVLGNDNLNGGTNPVISIVSQSPNGTASVVNGQIQFTPNNGFSGITTFTYRITASNGTSNIATVTVNVQSGNNGNICTDPEANVKGGSGSITITGITTSAAIIQVFNASWNSVYNQQVNTSSVTIPNLPAGNYTVKVSVLGTGGTWPLVCEKFVPVTVNAGGSNPPTAVNDNATTPQNTAVTITPLTNDQIPSGCTVQALSIVQQPTSGSVTVNGNNFLFTPANGFSGNVTFSYRIQSSCGTSNTATVTVNVQAGGVNCNEARNNTITKSCVNGATVLTGNSLVGYEYQWMISTSTCPSGNNGTAIAGATGVSYTLPAAVTQNTYFIRCARPIGCTAWDAITESNCITVKSSDCSSAGGCDAVSVVGNSNGTITVSGLGNYTSQILVFNNLWQPVSNQQYNTSSATISAKNGSYIVKVALYNTNGTWQFVCERVFPNISVTGAALLSNNKAALDLSANIDLHKVRLEWVNNTGNQNDYFEVEKLNLDLGTFEKIATVNSVSSDKLEHYATYDENPTEGNNVYRIALTKLDGSKKLSNETIVKFNKTVDFGIFPNPASDHVDVDLKQYEGKSVTLYVYNQFGHLIMTKKVEKASSTPIQLDMMNQIGGQYLMRVVSEGRKEATKKFMIQN